MRKARVYVDGRVAGCLLEGGDNERYKFCYDPDYHGLPVSLTMPLDKNEYLFDNFPPFFEGLLPEGDMLEGLLRQRKIDRYDLFAQLLAVGADTVGAVTVCEDTT